MFGIDVSQYEEKINWNKIKDKIAQNQSVRTFKFLKNKKLWIFKIKNAIIIL